MNKLFILIYCCVVILFQIFPYNSSLFVLQQCKIVRILAVLRNTKISKFFVWRLFACIKCISKHLLTNFRFRNVSIRTVYWISFLNREQVSLLGVCLKHSFINNAYQIFNTFLQVIVFHYILCLESLCFNIIDYCKNCETFVKFLTASLIPLS